MKTKKPMSKALAKEKADKIEALARGEDVDEPSPLDETPFGRPPTYKPEFVARAAELCLNGATDADLAAEFGVAVRTIERWRVAHPDFCRAVEDAKDVADDRVERSLYQKAIGYEREVQRASQGKVLHLTEYFPPDTAAAIIWLKNRRSQKWKDRQDHNHNHTLTLSQEFESFMRQVLSNPGHEETKVIEHAPSQAEEMLPLPREFSAER